MLDANTTDIHMTLMQKWKSNVRRKHEYRRHPQKPVDSAIRILWEDSHGHERVAEAKLKNISPSGLKILVRERIPIRSYVFCYESKLGIRARGSVRYCNAATDGYHIGLEFSDVLLRQGG